MQFTIRTLDEARESRAELIVQVEDGERTITMSEKNARIEIGEPGTGTMLKKADPHRELAEAQLKRVTSQLDEAKNSLVKQIDELAVAKVQIKELGTKHQRELASIRNERDVLKREIKIVQEQAREWDADRHTERDRADQNKAWAKHAEARLSKVTVEWEKLRALIQSITDVVAGNCLESWVTPPVQEVRRLIAESEKGA